LNGTPVVNDFSGILMGELIRVIDYVLLGTGNISMSAVPVLFIPPACGAWWRA
jgi:hypothetical protein